MPITNLQTCLLPLIFISFFHLFTIENVFLFLLKSYSTPTQDPIHLTVSEIHSCDDPLCHLHHQFLSVLGHRHEHTSIPWRNNFFFFFFFFLNKMLLYCQLIGSLISSEQGRAGGNSQSPVEEGRRDLGRPRNWFCGFILCWVREWVI